MASDLEYRDEDGQLFALGCEPRVTAVGDWPVYADDWLVPQSEWEERIANGEGDLSVGVQWILDQNPRGWCWSFAACQVEMVDRYLDGHAPELLLPDAAPVSMGIRGGYSIDGVLREFVVPVGYPPASVSPDTDPTKANARLSSVGQMASNWRALAAARKPKRWLDRPTAEHVVSAVLQGHPVEAGLQWSTAGGHALAVVRLEWQDGEVSLCGPNSWGLSFTKGWGAYGPSRPGWFRVPLGRWQVQTFGAWALVDENWAPEDQRAPEPPSS